MAVVDPSIYDLVQRTPALTGLPRHDRILPDGAWRSLASAPALGAGGRGFKSRRPDHVSLYVQAISISGEVAFFVPLIQTGGQGTLVC